MERDARISHEYLKNDYERNYAWIMAADMLVGFVALGHFIINLIGKNPYVPVVLIVSAIVFGVFCVLQYSSKNCTLISIVEFIRQKEELEELGYEVVAQEGHFCLGQKILD